MLPEPKLLIYLLFYFNFFFAGEARIALAHYNDLFFLHGATGEVIDRVPMAHKAPVSFA